MMMVQRCAALRGGSLGTSEDLKSVAEWQPSARLTKPVTLRVHGSCCPVKDGITEVVVGLPVTWLKMG